MLLLIQRVKKVYINDELNIKEGMLIFSGFTNGDDKQAIDKMVKKVLALRIFEDNVGKTNISINEINGEILSISQFTLYADLKGYNRPSFTNCLKYEEAKELFDYFNSGLKSKYLHTKCGVFGSDYQIDLINNGPFTVILDSNKV